MRTATNWQAEEEAQDIWKPEHKSSVLHRWQRKCFRRACRSVSQLRIIRTRDSSPYSKPQERNVIRLTLGFPVTVMTLASR